MSAFGIESRRPVQTRAETYVHVDTVALPASEILTAAPGSLAERATRRRIVWHRMLRVIRFDRTVYADIESDPRGVHQAAAIVSIVAVAAALGTIMLGAWRPGAIAGAIAAALIHWLLWSGLEHVIGTTLFRTQNTLPSSLRTLGYAQTPQLFAFFAFVPVAGEWIVLASRLMTLIAGTQALTSTLQLRRRQTLAIRLVSFTLSFAAAAMVSAVLGETPWLTAMLRP